MRITIKNKLDFTISTPLQYWFHLIGFHSLNSNKQEELEYKSSFLTPNIISNMLINFVSNKFSP